MHDRKRSRQQPEPTRSQAGHPPFEQAQDEINLRELLQKLNRRRKAIVGIFLLVVVATGLYLYQATPRYTATTQITLDIRKSRVVDIEEVLSGISADASVIGTELDIIRSSSLLMKLVEELRLDRDPEFNPELVADDEKGLVQGLVQGFRQWLAGLWMLDSEPAEELSPEAKELLLKQGIVRRLQENLKIEHRRQSHTISITVTSMSPRRAAQMANTLASLYQTDQLEAKFDATRRANEWLAERLDSLRREVQAAEQAVKNVRERSGIIQAGGTTVLEQQIGDVNAQLIEARVKRSRAEARLARAGEVMDQPGGVEGLGEVIGSKTIQQLRGEESTLRRKMAELSQRYGPRHPQMIQAEAEMRDLRNKIKEESNRILESLENEVQVARAEERSLQQSLNQLRSEAGKTMQAELELRELERQAQSSRTLYQNFLSRFQETREQEALQRPDARIISPAEVPTSPSHPKKKRTMALAGALGLMLGVMGAFMLESLDRGFRTGDQVEKDTGHPVFGYVPLLGRNQGPPADYVVKKRFSSYSESLRAIRTAIQLSDVDSPPRSVMVTSALPREGKSSFSLSMGRLSAMSGARTLLIDADLRRPTLAGNYPDLEISHRLEDVLQGNSGFEDALIQDPESGLYLLTAHGRAPAVSEMLGSNRMKTLLDTLEEQYDLVILDTLPVMGVSDAWTLAREIDSVIFLVLWAETPRETVRSALHQMELLDIDVDGIVLSMVNVHHQSKYGYGGYGYYYGKYRKYYKE